MAAAPTPNSLRVRLRTPEERSIWNNLAALPCHPSRHPDGEALFNLGMKQCFWELAEAGGLTHLFKTKAGSYLGLTLEFLTTLYVDTTDEGVVWSISFRLGNEEYQLGIDDIGQIFEAQGMHVLEPPDYDPNAFWRAITIQDEQHRRFNPARAKSSEIRNPVLRYMHKALACLPFGRTETGGVQSDELFVLWSILRKRPLLMGHYIVKHLETQAAKVRGSLSCGGIISVLAVAVGIDLDVLEPIRGETKITLDVLRTYRFWQNDKNRQAFLLQRAEDHFPLPNVQHTYVNGWTYDANWLMNGPIHQQIIAETPRTPWVTSRIYPLNYPYPPPHTPRAAIPPQYQEGQDGAAAEALQQQQPMDLITRPEGRSPPPESHNQGEGSRRGHRMGEGSSRGHRRTRAETDESEIEEMNRRMDDLQVAIQELKEEQRTRWDEYTAHRLEDLQWRTDQSAHWANYYAHRQEDLHYRQEQRVEDRAWRAQQNSHWDAYHANQQTEQEWRQEMYNARLRRSNDIGIVIEDTPNPDGVSVRRFFHEEPSVASHDDLSLNDAKGVARESINIKADKAFTGYMQKKASRS